jgi:NTE family protein
MTVHTIRTGPRNRGAVAVAAADGAAAAEGLRRHGQIVLVLQGGGALGAYQLGVYEALHAAGVEPDWIIGTSIGAINAALIAGNAPEDRLSKLCEFWRRVEHGPHYRALTWLAPFAAAASNWLTVTHGIPAFFQPNPGAFLGAHVPLGAEQAGYYSTQPLLATLSDLVDFERINDGSTRLTVGAANVRTGEMTYFDSRERPLGPRHIAASGALPPAFPAVRIDGELYWDGGILSNTPVEAVFDDMPRRNSLVFAVHIWNPGGPEPDTIWEVMNRQKDIQYASRAASHIARQKQMHKLRHIIAELSKALPADVAARPEIRDMSAYGCLTRMHVVRLLAPSLDGEDHTKDIDFSPAGIRSRRDAGRRDAEAMLGMAPWEGEFDPMEGFILHEVKQGVEVSAG